MKSIFHGFTVVSKQVQRLVDGQIGTQASQPGVYVQVVTSDMELLCQVYLVKCILSQQFKKLLEIGAA